MLNNKFYKSVILLLCLWLVIGGYYASLEFNALILWFFLSIPFGALVFIAWSGKQTVLGVLMIAVFLSHAILPPIFYIRRDEYSYSGWDAVKNFDFQLSSFLEIYGQLFVFYAGITVVVLMMKVFLRKQSTSLSYERKFDRLHKKSRGNGKGLLNNILFFDVMLFIVVPIFSVLNLWMFNSNIGLTGLTGGQDSLPFKLAGILYYFSRFLIPGIIFLMYRKSSRSFLLMIIIFSYAIFAGFSQVSRALFTFIIIPLLFFSVFDKRLKTFFSIFVAYIIIFPWIEIARGFVYAYSDGVVFRNSSDSLFYILGQVLADPPSLDFLKLISNIIARVGGGQDVVLGAQYNSNLSGGSWMDFKRIFFRVEGGFDAHYELFGFEPPFGFSTGSGGFSSMMLQIAGGTYFVLFLLSFLVSGFIVFGEWLCIQYQKIFGLREINIIMAVFFVMFFYVLGDLLWFYQFLFLAFGLLLVLKFRRRASRLRISRKTRIVNTDFIINSKVSS